MQFTTSVHMQTDRVSGEYPAYLKPPLYQSVDKI